MEKSSKIIKNHQKIITIIFVVAFLFLFALVGEITDRTGGGIIGLALTAGLIGGFRAIWKKNDNDKQPE